MNYHIPANTEEIIALQYNPVDEETIASAIAGVINIARCQGQTLDELTAEILKEDSILDYGQRSQLSDILQEAWQKIAHCNQKLEQVKLC